MKKLVAALLLVLALFCASAMTQTRPSIKAARGLQLLSQSASSIPDGGVGIWNNSGTVKIRKSDSTDVSISSGGGGSGTVTSIVAGTGLSGGTITSSGTIAIDSTVATLTGSQTLTNKTISSPVLSGTTTGTVTIGGTPTIASGLVTTSIRPSGTASSGTTSARWSETWTAVVIISNSDPPACDSAHKGMLVMEDTPADEADVLQICMKNASNVYAYHTVTVAP